MPWRRVGIGAGFALLGRVGPVSLYLSSGEVDIDPAPQRLGFEGGWPGLGFGGNRLLRPGKYTLVAEHQATSHCASRRGRQGRRATVSLQTEGVPGRLRIELPVTGQVSIDGKPAGKAPGEFKLAGGRTRS